MPMTLTMTMPITVNMATTAMTWINRAMSYKNTVLSFPVITSTSLPRRQQPLDEKVPHLRCACVLHIHCSKYRRRLWRSHPPSDGMSLVTPLASWLGQTPTDREHDARGPL